MLKWQQTENKNIVGFKSVILLCSEGNSVMLLSSIISCNKNVKNQDADLELLYENVIFAENKLHSANWKQAFFALVCIIFAEKYKQEV